MNYEGGDKDSQLFSGVIGWQKRFIALFQPWTLSKILTAANIRHKAPAI